MVTDARAPHGCYFVVAWWLTYSYDTTCSNYTLVGRGVASCLIVVPQGHRKWNSVAKGFMFLNGIFFGGAATRPNLMTSDPMMWITVSSDVSNFRVIKKKR